MLKTQNDLLICRNMLFLLPNEFYMVSTIVLLDAKTGLADFSQKPFIIVNLKAIISVL